MNYVGYENYIYKSSYSKRQQKSKKKLFLRLLVITLVVGFMVFFCVANLSKIASFLGLNKQLINDKQTFYILKYDSYDKITPYEFVALCRK